MKDGILKKLCLLGGGIYLATFLVYYFWPQSQAATITTGYTFSSGETNITHTKLNQAVNSATLSGVATADINNLAVTGAKIAASTIPGSKLQTNAVSGGAGGQINSNTVSSYNILAGTLTGSEFSNTVNFAAGTYNFTNATTLNFSTGQIASAAILGTNVSSGTAQSGLVPKLNTQGKLDNSLYYAPRATSIVLSAAASASTSLSTLLSHTASITNGTVCISGCVQYTNSSTGAGTLYVVVDSSISGNLYSGGIEITSSDIEGYQLPFSAFETLVNSAAATYTVKAKLSGTGGAWAKTGTLPNSTFAITNATRMNVIEIPTQ